jgi:hypothetical protein
MKGREFLRVARRLLNGKTEADWRSVANRAYYGLLQEAKAALEGWGHAHPRRDQLHAFVRLRFSFAKDPDLRQIGYIVDELSQLRNAADYQLSNPGRFGTDRPAQDAVQKAGDAIDLLDQIEADPARRAAAISALK